MKRLSFLFLAILNVMGTNLIGMQFKENPNNYRDISSEAQEILKDHDIVNSLEEASNTLSETELRLMADELGVDLEIILMRNATNGLGF